MRVYKTLLLAGAAALISTGAMADGKVLKVSNTLDEIFLEESTDTITVEVIDSVVNKVELNQLNKGNISATTRVNTDRVTGMEATAVAIGNNASFELEKNFGGDFQQTNTGDVSANLWSRHTHNGMQAVFDLTAVAIGNNLSVNLDDGSMVGSIDQTNTGDISASLETTIMGGAREVNTTAVAIANNTSIQFPLDGTFLGGVAQSNHGDVFASNKSNLQLLRDPATAVAIGNNFSITNKVPDVQ